MTAPGCKLNIAGVTLRFTGIPLKAEKYTLPFIVKNGYDTAEAEHTVRVGAELSIPVPEGEPDYSHYQIFCYLRGDNTYTLQITALGKQPIASSLDEAGRNETLVTIDGETPDWHDWLRRVLIYSCLPHIMLDNRRLMLHASYVVGQSGGIVFCAPSGTGKSTQAEIWRRYRGAQIVNGDRALLSLDEDMKGPLPFIQGVPPYREWPSAYTAEQRRAAGVIAHGMPFAGSSKICYNISSPLRALVILKQGPVSRAVRLRGAAAVKAVIDNSVVESWRPGENGKALELAAEIASRVPVYLLECTPDISAAEALEAAMAVRDN